MDQNTKKIIKISGLSIFFLVIFIYAFFVSKDLIFGVRIKNVNITDGIKITENILNINGNAKNATHIKLNGREISINQNGDFNETVALLPGFNIINIKAEDKFGYVDEKNYKLMHVN
ncbi:MAG: hypothetical protein AAB510_01335 [Patescibacteria group bacterium]